MALLLLSLFCAAGPSQYDIEEFARYSFELARSAPYADERRALGYADSI